MSAAAASAIATDKASATAGAPSKEAGESDYGYLRIVLMAPKSHANQAEAQDFRMNMPARLMTVKNPALYEALDKKTSATEATTGAGAKTGAEGMVEYVAGLVPANVARVNVGHEDVDGYVSLLTDYHVPVTLHNEGSCINVFYYSKKTDADWKWYRQVLYDCSDLGSGERKQSSTTAPVMEEWEAYGEEKDLTFVDTQDDMVLNMVVQRVGTKTTPPKPLSFFGGNREWALTKLAILVRDWASLK